MVQFRDRIWTPPAQEALQGPQEPQFVKFPLAIAQKGKSYRKYRPYDTFAGPHSPLIVCCCQLRLLLQLEFDEMPLRSEAAFSQVKWFAIQHPTKSEIALFILTGFKTSRHFHHQSNCGTKQPLNLRVFFFSWRCASTRKCHCVVVFVRSL